MDQTALTQWKPKEEKYVRWGVTAGLVTLATVLGSMFVLNIGPLVLSATVLLGSIFASGIKTITFGVGAAVTAFLGWETVMPSGFINKRLRQAYSILNNNPRSDFLAARRDVH